MSDVKLFMGDCLDVIPTLTGIDAVITDPPYGVDGAVLNPHRQSGKGRTVNDWHPPSTWDEFIDPAWCEAVCTVSPVIAWFGNWRRRNEVENAMKHPLRAEIIWAKNTHVGPPCPLAMRDERIWLFSQSGIVPRQFATSVWDIPIKHTQEHRWHKNEKPVLLMSKLILFLTDVGDTILDPFMGSGTTGVAAIKTGRNFIGCELDAAYFAIAERRIEQAQYQLPLLEVTSWT